MIKARLGGGAVLVTFELPGVVAAASASVCGEFNGWSPAAHPLTRTDSGWLHASVELPAGRRWRFRYLLDGQRWENDWVADDYVPNEHGGDDSVVDLTDTTALPLAPPAPPPGGDASAAAVTPAAAADAATAAAHSQPSTPPSTRSAGDGTQASSDATGSAPVRPARTGKRAAAGAATRATKAARTTKKPAKPSRAPGQDSPG